MYREELTLEVESENNPTRQDIFDFLKKDPELCVIKEIQGNFGTNIFKVEVFIYDSTDARNKIEYVPRKERKKLEETKKKEEELAKKEEEAKKASETKPEEVKPEEVKPEESKDGN